MNKITIIKIGLAGAAWNAISVLFVSIVGQMRIPEFGRFVMYMMQKYSAFGFNMRLDGIISGLIWSIILGFVQFAFMAYIFNILVSTKVVENIISRISFKNKQ